MKRLPACLGMLALASMVVLAGCAVEERLSPRETVPEPSWVGQPPEPESGLRYYVGIALADNILEEAQGRRRARENAAEQVAESIAADVSAAISRIDVEEGAVHKGQNVSKGRIHDEIRVKARQVLLRLTVHEYWYEKWFIREKPCTCGFTRYKHYALCSFPESEYKRLVDEAVGKGKK